MNRVLISIFCVYVCVENYLFCVQFVLPILFYKNRYPFVVKAASQVWYHAAQRCFHKTTLHTCYIGDTDDIKNPLMSIYDKWGAAKPAIIRFTSYTSIYPLRRLNVHSFTLVHTDHSWLIKMTSSLVNRLNLFTMRDIEMRERWYQSHSSHNQIKRPTVNSFGISE